MPLTRGGGSGERGLLLEELFRVVMNNFDLKDPTFPIPECGVGFTPDTFFYFFRYPVGKLENHDTVIPFERCEMLHSIACALIKHSD